MPKYKLFAVALIISLVGIVLSASHLFSSNAKNDDVLSEIKDYKNWTKLTKEPLQFQLKETAIQG